MSSSGYFAGWSCVQSGSGGSGGSDDPFSFTSFALLSASVMANTASLHTLTNKNNQTTSGIIGRWIYSPTLQTIESVGKINFANVSNSQYGTQHSTSSTTGLTRLLNSTHNMPSSGTCTVWSVTGSSLIASESNFTVSGDTITFDSDPGQSLSGDLFNTETINEFDELRVDGYWVPIPNTTPIWNSGLQLSDGACILYIGMNSNGDTTPSNISVTGRFELVNTASPLAGISSFASLGFRTTRTGNNYGNASGLKNDAGVWKKCLQFNNFDSATGPSTIYSSNTGTPGDETGANIIKTNLTIADSSTNNASWHASLYSDGLTAGINETGDAGSWTSFSMGTNGFVNGFLFSCKNINGGLMTGTLKIASGEITL